MTALLRGERDEANEVVNNQLAFMKSKKVDDAVAGSNSKPTDKLFMTYSR